MILLQKEHKVGLLIERPRHRIRTTGFLTCTTQTTRSDLPEKERGLKVAVTAVALVLFLNLTKMNLINAVFYFRNF